MDERPTGVTRITRRLRRRFLSRGDVATDHLVIDHIVSPLRYDVLVRQQLFAWLEDRPAGESRQARVLAARELPYAVWFGDVLDANPKLLRGRSRDEAFAAQLDTVASMHAGFDPALADPVLVRHVGAGTVTQTGKRLGPRWVLADGCHRVALLRRRGITTLEPHQYRVVDDPWPPRDNTARLLGMLMVTEVQYASFLAAGYDLGPCTNVAELRRALDRQPAEVRVEVEGILAVDVAHLNSAPGAP